MNTAMAIAISGRPATGRSGPALTGERASDHARAIRTVGVGASAGRARADLDRIAGAPGRRYSSPRYALRTISFWLQLVGRPGQDDLARSGGRSRGGRSTAPGGRSARRAGPSCPGSLISLIVCEHLLDEDRGEAERRLVEEQEPRLATSAPGRSRASAARRPTASRRAGGSARGGAGRASMTRSMSGPDRRLVAGERAHQEVLEDRHPGEDPATLGRVADALRGRGGGRRVREMSLPSKVDRARARVEQAADRLEGRRLAGAVGPDQRDDLALRRRVSEMPWRAWMLP